MNVRCVLHMGCDPYGFGILAEDRLLVVHHFQPNYSDSEGVVDLIAAALERVSLQLSDIEACIWVNGPGSYTGLRIGASLVNMLKLSFKCPVYSVDTWTAFAYSVSRPQGAFGIVCPGMRGYVAVRLFSADHSHLVPLGDGEMLMKDRFFDHVQQRFPKVPFYGPLSQDDLLEGRSCSISYTSVCLDMVRLGISFTEPLFSALDAGQWVVPNYLGQAVRAQ